MGGGANSNFNKESLVCGTLYRAVHLHQAPKYVADTEHWLPFFVKIWIKSGLTYSKEKVLQKIWKVQYLQTIDRLLKDTGLKLLAVQ
jgi:hypothetical protein